MFGRFFGAFGWVLVLAGAAQAQVVTTYYEPALVPVAPRQVRTMYYVPSVVVPATTYYAPNVAAPVTTYYAPSQPASDSAPATTYYAPPANNYQPRATYYAPSTTYYAAPAAGPVPAQRVTTYHSSVTSMPMANLSSAIVPTPVPAGAPVVESLAPPVVTYRPVVAAPQAYFAPQSYVMTRGLFGRPKLYPVNPAPVQWVPVFVP